MRHLRHAPATMHSNLVTPGSHHQQQVHECSKATCVQRYAHHEQTLCAGIMQARERLGAGQDVGKGMPHHRLWPDCNRVRDFPPRTAISTFLFSLSSSLFQAPRFKLEAVCPIASLSLIWHSSKTRDQPDVGNTKALLTRQVETRVLEHWGELNLRSRIEKKKKKKT